MSPKIALGTYNFATAAKFPMSGFNGIGLIFYHLWGLPIGIVALVLNIPVAIACYKTLGNTQRQRRCRRCRERSRSSPQRDSLSIF